MEYTDTTRVPSTVQEMDQQASERMRNVRAAVDEYLSRASETAREAAAYADRRVQSNPWTAVGIGFGVGMIFGALIAMAAAKSPSGIVDRLT